MSWTYAHGETLRVWRGERLDDGYSHGGEADDAEVVWDNPTQVGPDQPRRPLAMESSMEAPTEGAPLILVERLTAYLVYGSDVQMQDRVEVVTGPYTGIYEVEGRPGHWSNPYTGDKPGTVVRLGLRIGG